MFSKIILYYKMAATTRCKDTCMQTHTCGLKQLPTFDDLFISTLSLQVIFWLCWHQGFRRYFCSLPAFVQKVTCQVCRTGRDEKTRWINCFKEPCNLPGAAITCFYGNQAGQFSLFWRRMARAEEPARKTVCVLYLFLFLWHLRNLIDLP